LGKNAHTWSDFENRYIRAGIHRIGDALCYIEVGQEVLTEILLRLYSFHILIFILYILQKYDYFLRIHTKYAIFFIFLGKKGKEPLVSLKKGYTFSHKWRPSVYLC